MSFESDIKKQLLELVIRIERMEEIYPQIYLLMINLKMIAERNSETSSEVTSLMDSIKFRLEKIENFMTRIN